MDTSFFNFKLFKVQDLDAGGVSTQGQLKKGLLLFFEAPATESAELTDFLAKILDAIDLDLKEDTLFINRKPTESLKISEILEREEIKQVLIFGIPPNELGIRFVLPAYQQVWHQGKGYLWADSLPAIFAERQAGGKAMSGKLWQAIQQFDL